MIIQKKTLKNVLFLDIETVPTTKHFHQLPESLRNLWMHKSKQFLPDRSTEMTEDIAASLYNEKAGLFAEFGKVICISVGYLSKQKNRRRSLRIKSLHGEEVEILRSFNEILNLYYDDPNRDYLCGHNIREFDIPFICRRNIIHNQHLPYILNISNKKPWQLEHIVDTLQLWKFGEYKNFTSLALLTGVLGIPTPKDVLNGRTVADLYWEDNDIERIVKNCENNVLATTQVVMKFSGQPLLGVKNVKIVTNEVQNVMV